jgi:branched-chain amino acid transport system permease protein
MLDYLIDLLQTAIDGLLFGSTYALVAIGFSIIWGLLRILNLAHGQTVMVGMFAGMVCATILKLPIVVGFLAAMAAACVVGIIIERVCYHPLRNAHELVPMIATLGFWIFSEEAFIKVYFHTWFRGYMDFPNPYTFIGFDVGPIRLRLDYLITLAVSATLVAILYFVVYRTRFGLAMRMVAEGHDIGYLMGVPVRRVLTGTFLLASAYGGAAGYLIGMSSNLASPQAGTLAVVKGLFAMILGGSGSIVGAIVGGMTLGVLELTGAYVVSFAYRDAIAMIILFAVLIVRPQGIAGKATLERV